MNKLIISVTASGLLAASTSLATAAGSGRGTASYGTVLSTATLSDTPWTVSDKVVIAKLNDRYPISRSNYTIEELRSRLTDWDSVVTALVIAQHSLKKIDSVLSLRDSGLDWDQIAQRYNLSRDAIKHEVESVKKDINQGLSKR